MLRLLSRVEPLPRPELPRDGADVGLREDDGRKAARRRDEASESLEKVDEACAEAAAANAVALINSDEEDLENKSPFGCAISSLLYEEPKSAAAKNILARSEQHRLASSLRVHESMEMPSRSQCWKQNVAQRLILPQAWAPRRRLQKM
mmetsp:Transcript_121/g.243  ORF Transcript_121/g.243 Transcript_121/m.243 type:complete len:148 (-) Transcript_121:230-673(-)